MDLSTLPGALGRNNMLTKKQCSDDLAQAWSEHCCLPNLPLLLLSLHSFISSRRFRLRRKQTTSSWQNRRDIA